MLQTISWRDYFITIGLGTALYYGWWLIHYYPAWQKRKPDPPEGKTVGGGTTAGAGDPMEKTATGAVGTNRPQQVGQPERAGQPQGPQQAEQPEPPQPELPFPSPAFLAVTAANCKNDLLRLFEKVLMAEATETECLDLLRGLLTAGPYPKLKGTIFQENIDALIVRELNRHGSIRVDPEVVPRLWQA